MELVHATDAAAWLLGTRSAGALPAPVGTGAAVRRPAVQSSAETYRDGRAARAGRPARRPAVQHATARTASADCRDPRCPVMPTPAANWSRRSARTAARPDVLLDHRARRHPWTSTSTWPRSSGSWSLRGEAEIRLRRVLLRRRGPVPGVRRPSRSPSTCRPCGPTASPTSAPANCSPCSGPTSCSIRRRPDTYAEPVAHERSAVVAHRTIPVRIPPEPAFIPASLAEELAARGHEVRVLTGLPELPTGAHLSAATGSAGGTRPPTGRVTLRRVPLYPSHDASAVRRGANYLSFAATSSVAALRFLRQCRCAVRVPPAAHRVRRGRAAAAGCAGSRRCCTCRTSGPTRSRVAMGRRAAGPLQRVSGAAMRRTLPCRRPASWSSHPRCATRSSRAAPTRPGCASFSTGPTRRCSGPCRPPTRPGGRSATAGRCTVMHAGNIGPFQNVAGAVRAAAAARARRRSISCSSARASRRPARRRLAAELGAGNVRFLGRRDPAEMAALYGAADFQLVSLRDLPALRGTIPSKLQAALSCGSPGAGRRRRRLRRGWSSGTGSGLDCPPDDWPRWPTASPRPPTLPDADAGRDGPAGPAQLPGRRCRCGPGVDQLEDMLVGGRARRRR